jgi:hypothetical protein
MNEKPSNAMGIASTAFIGGLTYAYFSIVSSSGGLGRSPTGWWRSACGNIPELPGGTNCSLPLAKAHRFAGCVPVSGYKSWIG